MTSPLPASVVAARRAASLAVDVPGISLLVYQHDWPPLFVSDNEPTPTPGQVWTTLDPYEFRRELMGNTGRASRLIGPALASRQTDVRICVATSGTTTFDDAWVFTVKDDDETTIGFVTLADVDHSRVWREWRSRRPLCVSRQPTVSAVDAELGTQVLGWTIPTDDTRGIEAAYRTVFDMRIATGAEELVLLSSAA